MTKKSGTAAADAEQAAAAAPSAARALGTGAATLRYTTLRLGLFVATLVVLWGLAYALHMDLSSQLSRLSLLAVALLISSALSLVLLSRQRDAMSAGFVAKSQRLSRKFNDAASIEDEDE